MKHFSPLLGKKKIDLLCFVFFPPFSLSINTVSTQTFLCQFCLTGMKENVHFGCFLSSKAMSQGRGSAIPDPPAFTSSTPRDFPAGFPSHPVSARVLAEHLPELGLPPEPRGMQGPRLSPTWPQEGRPWMRTPQKLSGMVSI